MNDRFRIVSDDDCHRYVIPADKVGEFNRWLYEESEDDPYPPEWAQRLHMHESQYTFTDWREG